MSRPRDTGWRCPSFGQGVDGRSNQCARGAGHDGAHRNRSGRVKWTDGGAVSVRLMATVNDPAHRKFGEDQEV